MLKKSFCIFLSLVFAFILCTPAFADDKCTCGEAPIIYVAALGSASIYLNEGTESQETIFRPDTGAVIKKLLPLVPAAAELIATKNYDRFGDTLISCVNDTFGMLALDNNGKSLKGVTAEEHHPESAEHGLHNSYYFGYDFRLDPIENAEKLHEYIQEVKSLTRHDTIRFRASSMGGVVAMSYIRLYGTADIETIIFQCCPILGTAVAGELYCGKVELNKDALLRYGEQALPSLDSDFLGAFLYSLIELFEAGGVWEDLIGLGDKLVDNLKDRIFDECLIPIFANNMGIWSFVPDKYFEEAKIFMKLDETEQKTIIDKIDFYHYEVQSKAEELLKGAQAAGTNVYILCGYNMQRTPLVTAYMNNSDGTVDTCYASCGATVADLNDVLPADYEQARFTDKNFISADGVIDASTCILPENTWFVKDMLHCKTHNGHAEFYDMLFESKEQLTVFDDEKYPQFLQNDTVNEKFTPVAAQTENEKLVYDVVNAANFLHVIKLLISFLKSLFAAL